MKPWNAICGACAASTAGVSVICMSSMGAVLAAASAAVGAGAAGMAGMGSMGAPQAGRSAFLWLAQFFESMGLGILNQLPNEVAQPLLAALLVISVATTYMAYRGHHQPGVLVLALGSAPAIYASIYLWMSEPLYFMSLAGLVAAAMWGIFLSRTRGRSQPDKGLDFPKTK